MAVPYKPVVNKTTDEARNKIRRATVITMPDRPSERGIRATDIKSAMAEPICGSKNSVLAELDRVVDEVNVGLGVVQTSTDSKVDKTTKINGHPLTGNVVLTPADLGLADLYQYRGTVATFEDLPAEGVLNGDTYNVLAAHDKYPAGTNYAWKGTEWDPLGGEFDTSNLQVRTRWLQDTSAVAVNYTMADNGVKAFGAENITAVNLVLPDVVNIGYMSMVCVKHGAVPPAYTFVNPTGKRLVFVQFGMAVDEYVPSPNCNVRFLPSCVDGETVEILIVELGNE